MTLYLNRLVRLVLLLSVMVGLVACKPNPQDDIALFQPFITENINKKSADPYISSTVKPGDKMYDILVNIQHGRHDSASNKLQALIDENDSDAMVWYAKLIYRSSINNRPKALSLYQTAMEDDNPYAYIMLSPGLISSGCARYFGEKNCTQEHFNRAIELFKPLAAQGDLRAQYFLLKQQELEQSKDTRVQYIQEVIRFSQAHYYQPLMDYVNTILIRPQGKVKYEAKTPEQYQLVVQLLTIAANNNYIPAIEFIVRQDVDMKSNDELYLKLKKLSGTHYYKTRFFEFKNEFNNEQLYCYAALYEAITGSDKLFLGVENKKNVTKDCDIEKEISYMTPMVYIDGFTSRDDWVD